MINYSYTDINKYMTYIYIDTELRSPLYRKNINILICGLENRLKHNSVY